MLVAKGEGELLEDSVTHFEDKYWLEYLMLFNTLFTCIEARKLDGEKVPYNITKQ